MNRSPKAALLAAALWAASLCPALAQSSPGWTYGQVPTTAQWNAEWASKQDYLGAAPLLVTGGTMTGPLVTLAPTTSSAGFNLSPGTAPTTPNDGDLWVTAVGIYARVNGVTYDLLIATAGSIGVGTTTVTGGPGILYNTSSGGTLAALAAVNNGIVSFNGSGTLQATTSPNIGTATGTSLALGGATIGTNALAISGTETITSSNAAALAAGANGATNPVLQVDASTSSVATGLDLKGAAAGGGMALSVISSGTNENLTINAKGSGSVTIANASSGGILLDDPTTVTSNSASALAVGANGATNPVLKIDASVASQATGLQIQGEAAGTGVQLTAIDSSTNSSLAMNAKGSGAVQVGSVSTGGVALAAGGGGVSVTGALTASSPPSTSAANQYAYNLNGTLTVTMPTTAISSGACGSATSVAVTGLATTDLIDVGFNSDPTASAGFTAPNMLAVVPYPTAGNANFKYCNNTGASITPAAMTFNFRVRR